MEEGDMMTDILGQPVITAAEMDAMTPAQRQAAFDASIVTDLDSLPAAYLARLRADAAELIARRDGEQAAGWSAQHAS
jgi:hypothetical protein